VTRILATLALATVLVAARAEAQAAPPAVRAGMTEQEVKAAWGEPQATRQRGAFTYLVFPTACLPGCGSHDVVILENGKVIDAIARSDGRRYEGAPHRPPAYTAPEAPR
jgi:hypothetical protein